MSVMIDTLRVQFGSGRIFISTIITAIDISTVTSIAAALLSYNRGRVRLGPFGGSDFGGPETEMLTGP